MIPRVIHRWWHGDLPDTEPYVARLLRGLNPGWQLRDWTPTGTLPADADIGSVLAEANRFRIEVLMEDGGIWLDHDMIPLQPFGPELLDRPWTAAAGSQRAMSAMGFPAGHPMLTQMREAQGAQPLGGDTVAKSTGSELLEYVGREHHDVLRRPEFIPFGVDGLPVAMAGRSRYYCVHLWRSSAAWTGPGAAPGARVQPSSSGILDSRRG